MFVKFYNFFYFDICLQVEESMNNLETVVRERNKAYYDLEVGEIGERPGQLVTSILGKYFQTFMYSVYNVIYIIYCYFEIKSFLNADVQDFLQILIFFSSMYSDYKIINRFEILLKICTSYIITICALL